MKKSRILFLTALAAAVLVLPVLAGAAPRGNAPNPAEILRNPRALARFLRLTPTQVETLKDLRGELQDKVEPLHEQQKPLREQLRTQLDAASPNACEIGDTMLDIQDLREQIEAAILDFDRKFSAILTPEQLRKYEALKEAAKLLRGGPEGDDE